MTDIPYISTIDVAKRVVTPTFIQEIELDWSKTYYSIEAVKRSYQAKLDDLNKYYQPRFRQAVLKEDIKYFKACRLRYFRRIYELAKQFDNHIDEWNKFIASVPA